MSKTIRNGPDSNQKSSRNEAPNKQKVPDPYPPVDPVVAQREQKDR